MSNYYIEFAVQWQKNDYYNEIVAYEDEEGPELEDFSVDEEPNTFTLNMDGIFVSVQFEDDDGSRVKILDFARAESEDEAKEVAWDAIHQHERSQNGGVAVIGSGQRGVRPLHQCSCFTCQVKGTRQSQVLP
ncbi:MAG: hypothetical protein JSR72_23740 [Proteobacteria bacterium]|nr:hypothetical protein [Pseudomonadota bacterium]